MSYLTIDKCHKNVDDGQQEVTDRSLPLHAHSNLSNMQSFS